MTEILKVAEQFATDSDIVNVFEIKTGLINGTYRLEGASGTAYLLQSINTDIFKDADGLMRNIAAVTEHLREKIRMCGGDVDREALQLIPTRDGKIYWDGDGVWRMYRYITGAKTYDRVTSMDMFREVGRSFGEFQRKLADFDASQLTETIPAFHDTVARYVTFEKTVERDAVGRRSLVEDEIAFFMERKKHAGFIVDGVKSGRFPLRVTHNDTKLNNIMLDDLTGKGICVLDLDTVMPGSVLADFGDAIRFGASTAAEDETDLSLVSLDVESFDAYTNGFIDGLEGALTEEEVLALPMGAYMMTLECGLRFLTDYLDGDNYFRVKHPLHNLERARNQMKLLSDMEDKMSQMQDIVRKYLSK